MQSSHARTLVCAFCLSIVLAACGVTATPTIAPTTVPSSAAPPSAVATTGGGVAARPGSSPVVGTPAAGGSGGAATPAATPVSAAPKLPVTVTDQRGTKVTITDISRIIPLSGDVAEVVWALGFGKNVVATDTSAIYPPETRQTPRVGFYRTVAAEGILTHRPTVILASENAGPPEALEQLRGAGVPVVIIPAGTDLAAPAQKIRAIGAALGVPEAGEQLAAQTQREIDEAKALASRATTKPRVMFLNMRGTTVQQISGTNAPAHALIEAAGGIDAGAEAGIVGYKAITAEAVAAGQPDVFLMFSGGLTSINGVEGLLQMPGIAQTPAGQAKRVLAYEDQYLLGFGPRTGQALRELALDLHPELK